MLVEAHRMTPDKWRETVIDLRNTDQLYRRSDL
jgi:hypothetical protein